MSGQKRSILLCLAILTSLAHGRQIPQRATRHDAPGKHGLAFGVAGMNSRMAVDRTGNVYILPGADDCLLKESLVEGHFKESTVACDVRFAGGVAADEKGDIYIEDDMHDRVLKEAETQGTYKQREILSVSSGVV